MSRIIPNQNTWVGFSETEPAVLNSPTEAEILAADTLTCYISSINASSQGNTVPTPDLCSLFETSVPGTSTAQFQSDMYRDDEDDLAWNVLPRGQKGVFYISRFGGLGEEFRPVSGQKVEVWPVQVTSRTAGALSSNTPQSFSVTCAVPKEPEEDGVVDAATARTLTATVDASDPTRWNLDLEPIAAHHIDYGDGESSYQNDGHSVHYYQTAGEYTAVAKVADEYEVTTTITATGGAPLSTRESKAVPPQPPKSEK